MASHYDQDPSDTPTTEVIVRQGKVEIRRYQCESKQEVAEVIAYWAELSEVVCDVVDPTTGRDEGATDIAWTDALFDQPAMESSPAY